MEVDIRKIKEVASNSTDLDKLIDGIFERCAHDDPPGLSGLIAAAADGSQPMLEALAAKYEEESDLDLKDRMYWNLQILRDEWGNKPEPDDEYCLRRTKPLEHRPGKPLTGDEISIDKMLGDYERKWIQIRRYKLDEKGCIQVLFQDAVTLLNTRGIHYMSRKPLGVTNFKEQTETPAKAPNGQMLNVWYWQVCEAPKKIYDKLPKLKKTGKPKRGIAPIEVIRAWEEKQKKEVA